MSVLPRIQLLNGVLPGSLCGMHVCVFMLSSRKSRVGWHGGTCVRVRAVSLFVFRDRPTILSENVLLDRTSGRPPHEAMTEL